MRFVSEVCYIRSIRNRCVAAAVAVRTNGRARNARPKGLKHVAAFLAVRRANSVVLVNENVCSMSGGDKSTLQYYTQIRATVDSTPARHRSRWLVQHIFSRARKHFLALLVSIF